MLGKQRLDERSDLLSSFKDTMFKLQTLAKKYLDKDIKVLVKHKLLDNTLQPTDKGLEFLASYLFSVYKKELAAELRAEVKEEDDEDCEEEEKVTKKKK